MKNKKGLLWGIIGLIVVVLVGVGIFFFINKDKKNDTKKPDTPAEKEELKYAPLLYKVTKEGSDNVIYLFGSIHVADERAYPIPEVVQKAFDESDYLAVEVDIVNMSQAETLEAIEPMMVENGKMLKDYLSKDGYTKIVDFLRENGAYSPMMEAFKPAYIESLVTSIAYIKGGLNANAGIDVHFLGIAGNKEILEYENAKFQYELLASLPDAYYEKAILAMIEHIDESAEETKHLYEAWYAGDEEKIIEYGNADEVASDENDPVYIEFKEELDEFNNKLLEQRNVGMVNKTIQFFEEGKKTFVVVGVLHVVGEEGLAHQLELAGYKVEKIDTLKR